MNAIAPAPNLRGDYASAAADYTLPQRHERIPPRDHATWRELYRRQSALFPRHAADVIARVVALPRVDRLRLRGLGGQGPPVLL